MKPIERVRARAQAADGFQNLVLRIGEGSTTMGGAQYRQSGLSWDTQRLDALYRESWLVGVVVDAVAEDMTKGGIDLSGIDPEDSAKLQRQLTRRGVWTDLTSAIKWGRLYGGAVAVINIDGQDMASPLNLDTVTRGSFNRLQVFDRWSITPDPSATISTGADMGRP